MTFCRYVTGGLSICTWFIIHYIKLLCLSWNPSCLYNVWMIFFFSFQAMLCYWFTSNAFSLLQVMFLKIPVIRDKLSIPQLIKHDANMMPKKKGFLEGFKESKWSINNFPEWLVKVLKIFFFLYSSYNGIWNNISVWWIRQNNNCFFSVFWLLTQF